jgi:hypothetical protein
MEQKIEFKPEKNVTQEGHDIGLSQGKHVLKNLQKTKLVQNDVTLEGKHLTMIQGSLNIGSRKEEENKIQIQGNPTTTKKQKMEFNAKNSQKVEIKNNDVTQKGENLTLIQGNLNLNINFDPSQPSGPGHAHLRNVLSLLFAAKKKAQSSVPRLEQKHHLSYGLTTLPNGTKCDGNYADGRLHGPGKEIYLNLTIFEGEFFYGLKHGKGTLRLEKSPCGRSYQVDQVWDKGFQVVDKLEKILVVLQETGDVFCGV